MADYINRDALLQEIEQERRASKNSFPRQYFVVGDVLNCIRTAPAVNVALVRHGRWIVFDPKNAESKECSMCGYLFSRLYPSNYCPNCGARMDEEDGCYDQHPSDPM